jgi:hypothetical protein
LLSRVVNGVFLFKSLLKNADPRGCKGRQNALFERADRFVLRAGSALVRSERDLAALPIFRGIGLQSIEPPKIQLLVCIPKKFKKKLDSQKRQLRRAKICSTLIGPSHMKK